MIILKSQDASLKEGQKALKESTVIQFWENQTSCKRERDVKARLSYVKGEWYFFVAYQDLDVVALRFHWGAKVSGYTTRHVVRLAKDWIGHGVGPCEDGSRGVGKFPPLISHVYQNVDLMIPDPVHPEGIPNWNRAERKAAQVHWKSEKKP